MLQIRTADFSITTVLLIPDNNNDCVPILLFCSFKRNKKTNFNKQLLTKIKTFFLIFYLI